MAIMQQMMARGGQPEEQEEMMEAPEQELEAEEPEMEVEQEGGQTIPREIAAAILAALQKPGVKRAVIKASQSEDPANALSGLAYGMLQGLDEKSGGSIPAEQMPSIAMELVEMLTSLAGASTGQGGDDQLTAQVLTMLLEKSMGEAEQKLSRGQPQGGPPQGGPPQGGPPQGMQMPQPMGVQ